MTIPPSTPLHPNAAAAQQAQREARGDYGPPMGLNDTIISTAELDRLRAEKAELVAALKEWTDDLKRITTEQIANASPHAFITHRLHRHRVLIAKHEAKP